MTALLIARKMGGPGVLLWVWLKSFKSNWNVGNILKISNTIRQLNYVKPNNKMGAYEKWVLNRHLKQPVNIIYDISTY